MTNRKHIRRRIERARKELHLLQGIARVLDTTPSRAGTPDMVEVEPGVWARLPQPSRERGLLGRALEVLDQADELERRAKELVREYRR